MGWDTKTKSNQMNTKIEIFLGVAKTRSVARDAEVLAFTDMVRQIRSKYKYSNLLTNPGIYFLACFP